MPTTPTATPAGTPVSESAQSTLSSLLQNQATADGNGTVASVDGYDGANILEIQKSGAGTTSVVVEGSFDSATWYSLGFQQTDATAVPARSVSAIALAAGAVNHVFQLLDPYPFIRARMTGTAGAVSVLARLYSIPE